MHERYELRLGESFAESSDRNLAAISELAAILRKGGTDIDGLEILLASAKLDRDMWAFTADQAMRTAQRILLAAAVGS